MADRRASTPSNAAEIAVPDWEDIKGRLEKLSQLSRQAIDARLQGDREKLRSLGEKRVLTEPGVQIDERRVRLDYLRDMLISAQEKNISLKHREFSSLAASLDAMSPLRVLSRGYAVASDTEGNTIKSASELKAGEKISLRFSDGGACCTVDKLNAKN